VSEIYLGASEKMVGESLPRSMPRY